MHELPQKPDRMDQTMREARIDVGDLSVDLTHLTRALGYCAPVTDSAGSLRGTESRREMPPHMKEVAEAMLSCGLRAIRPRAVWRWMPATLDSTQDAVRCSTPVPTVLRVGRLVRVQLRGSSAIAAFVVTIGRELEAKARAMMDEGQSLEGYVLDTVGSIAVEAVADVLESRISEVAAEDGFNITNRYSPGYCTWTTGEQQALFSLFPEDPAGVTLSKSSLMSPIKSVSGIIGLGDDVEHRQYMCDICTMETCHMKLTKARL